MFHNIYYASLIHFWIRMRPVATNQRVLTLVEELFARSATVDLLVAQGDEHRHQLGPLQVSWRWLSTQPFKRLL